MYFYLLIYLIDHSCEWHRLSKSVHILHQHIITAAKIFKNWKNKSGLKMWVFNEPAVRCVFRCCSTVCWGDLNRQSKDNRKEKKTPATSTLHNLANKKAAVIDKAKPCPCSIAECGFDFNQICSVESEKAKYPWKCFSESAAAVSAAATKKFESAD